MTQGQRETLTLIYVNTCNALMYADNFLLDSDSKVAKDSVRVIRDKLKWIKTAMDIKVNVDNSKGIDTLRFDEINRLLSSMPEAYADRLESTIVKFLDDIEQEIKKGDSAP